MTLASAPINWATWDSLELCVWRNGPSAETRASHPPRRRPPSIESGALTSALLVLGNWRENEAEPTKGRDEGGDDGGAENGDARRIAAVGARLHVTAAARHVAAMPEEVPEQHAKQGENQARDQKTDIRR